MTNFNFSKTLFILILTTTLFLQVNAHGRMLDPPNRSSIWRFPEFQKYNPPVNYDDNQLYCGGYKVQYEESGGKCGICGDPYSNPQPRDNEDGGKYGRGIIVRNYTSGQKVPVTVQLTQTHLGYFEFRLCADNSVSAHLTQTCYDRYLLPMGDGSGTKYPISGSPRTFNLAVQLPENVRCQQCVMQWNYRTGNSWGSCGNGTGAMGCGNQETFRGCADIAIK